MCLKMLPEYLPVEVLKSLVTSWSYDRGKHRDDGAFCNGSDHVDGLFTAVHFCSISCKAQVVEKTKTHLGRNTSQVARLSQPMLWGLRYNVKKW